MHAGLTSPARRTDESIVQLQQVIEMDLNFNIAHLFLAQAYQQKGMFAEAISEIQATKGLPEYRNIGFLGHAFAVASRKREARRVLARLHEISTERYVHPYMVALIYAGLGENDQAFDWLERAYSDRFWMMAFLKVDPRLDPLRQDPRFSDLLSRMGFK